MIKVRNLSKHFKVKVHHRGAWGAVRNLFSRQYRVVKAVDAVTFQIGRGELVGYLGPNGAGKSTTIKMLTGLLVPSAGEVVVDGRVPWRRRRAHVQHLGAVFGQRTTLWWDLPVVESLALLRHVYRIPAGRFRRNLAEFEAMLELGPFLDTPVRSLSLGQRMRADLCAALLHDPPLLFLDEPTIGLDVVARERIRRFIRHVNEERATTVLLTTHDLADVKKLCRRVLIVDRGRLLYDGTLDRLQERFGGSRELVVEFAEEYRHVAVPGAEVVARREKQVTYHFRRDAVSASALINRLSRQYRIRDLAVREPDVETTIRRIYEERLLD